MGRRPILQGIRSHHRDANVTGKQTLIEAAERLGLQIMAEAS
jgi:hypothetical protein